MADNIKLSDLLKGSGYEETPKEVKKYSDIQLAPGKKIVLQANRA